MIERGDNRARYLARFNQLDLIDFDRSTKEEENPRQEGGRRALERGPTSTRLIKLAWRSVAGEGREFWTSQSDSDFHQEYICTQILSRYKSSSVRRRIFARTKSRASGKSERRKKEKEGKKGGEEVEKRGRDKWKVGADWIDGMTTRFRSRGFPRRYFRDGREPG